MFSRTTPYVEPLGNHLILKSVSTTEEVERLADFNSFIHDPHNPDGSTPEPTVAYMTRTMIMHHPHMNPDEWLYVEDEATGKIVSSLCLIPWTWRYAGVELRIGEMGIVGTLEEYRRRGLIRALDKRFKTLLNEGEYDLSIIQGIPYFYRLLGYEYSLPLEGGWTIQLRQIPDELPPSAQGWQFREATRDDIPDLMRLHERTMCDLDLHAPRDAATWRYVIDYASYTAGAYTNWLVLDASGQPAGYFRVEKFGFSEGLNIHEVSWLSHGAAMAVLGKLKAIAIERSKPFVRLVCSDTCPLIPTAKAWGAKSDARYAWQILVPDPARLLRTITPVLEQRIAASPFAGLTETVCLNLYREAFELRFEAGRLVAVDKLGFRPWEGSNNLPPNTFAPLVLGYRSREELHATYPDVGVWGQTGYLFDVLFPKMSAFFYSPY
jgi:hypothetical protein